ncbi:MAG: Transcriptional regulator, MerR family [uncultured Rubrobacteraceae bacterium]|uniref:Transcriptional regulator, MerR family n=1 Tax=uncultured Rubrobacteraceae bacterium TaxID=349277 RepID=A0A6J4QQQ8_9ACTN|nr:MAG: Transcriptional regulator, MerR family [uncultured Rubrobacteraceae bacterium]
METRQSAALKVGELAKQTGLSVRTLHYYDEIGLLSPSRRTEAGHRLYTAGDVDRLRQINSLRYLGASLEEIREILDAPDFSPRRVIEQHLARLREQIKLQQKLCDRLEEIAARLSSKEEGSAEELVQTVEVIRMSERLWRYYTPEQREEIEERGRGLGEERIRQVEAEWPELMEQVRAEMEAGTDPSDERVQRLAKRWMELVREFTGGNPEIESSVRNVWRQEETIHGVDTGPMREMGEYISRAMAASKKPK